ncbi:MAG: TraB/VirB10 family protein [Rhodospirillaceae bacterium]|nr:TraB/VirB10 family protein [Rhodospirillaceae bacterium]
MTSGDPRIQAIQRRQILLFSGLAGTLLLVFVLWFGAGGGDAPETLRGIQAELVAPGSAEAGWVSRSETRLGAIETQLREIENRNSQLERDNLRLQERLAEDAENAQLTIDTQAAVIEELTGSLDSPAPGPAAPVNPFAPAGGGAGARRNPPDGAQVPGAGEPALRAPLMRTFELQDPPPSNADGGVSGAPNAEKPLSRYVPAGSYAEAVVLAGADASAGVQSQGDPRPVLLRLTGPAYGAAVEGVATRTDLEGCTVTGAAFGDLSSEKVYVRLQTMVCAGESPDSVIETSVAGFVAGGGRAGVRGPVVSREGALVERAFMAGVFSGFGRGASQAFGPQAVLAGGGAATVANTDLESIGRSGLGAGAATAGEAVSDYLIRRAEQYQPVVQLSAGSSVTVVFLEGAWLDGRTGAALENQG